MSEPLIKEELTKKTTGAAIEVHRYWGPGLVESIYEKSLAVELEKCDIPFQRQLKLELNHNGLFWMKTSDWISSSVIRRLLS